MFAARYSTQVFRPHFSWHFERIFSVSLNWSWFINMSRTIILISNWSWPYNIDQHTLWGTVNWQLTAHDHCNNKDLCGAVEQTARYHEAKNDSAAVKMNMTSNQAVDIHTPLTCRKSHHTVGKADVHTMNVVLIGGWKWIGKHMKGGCGFNSWCYLGMCLEESYKDLCQNSRCLGQESNRQTPGYKSEFLHFSPR